MEAGTMCPRRYAGKQALHPMQLAVVHMAFFNRYFFTIGFERLQPYGKYDHKIELIVSIQNVFENIFQNILRVNFKQLNNNTIGTLPYSHKNHYYKNSR